MNAFVTDVHTYALLRFAAGFGLAGELGAAITLVSEALPQQSRGLGAAFIATIGFAGATTSSFTSQFLDWKQAYELGGVLGILLLIARIQFHESNLFVAAKTQNATANWGSFSQILFSKKRLKLYALGLIAGIPIWYVAGILSYFAPELAREFNIQGEVSAGTTIMVGYIGAMLGDIACGLTSQKLQSRKKAVFGFMAVASIVSLFSAYFLRNSTPQAFYLSRFIIGFGNGYVALLIIWFAEVFGTNLRATVTITISNLIRGAVIPLTIAMSFLKPRIGMVSASVWIGVVCFSGALIATLFIPETFHRDLDFIEE